MAEATVETPKGSLDWLKANLGKLSKHSDIVFAVGILAIIAVLLFPIPTPMLDFLLSLSITFSVLILMNVLFIGKPMEFNSFPTILLLAAIIRLALNIASTRLILSEGHNGPDAAGHIIQAFGNFVMSGSVVIGAIVFAILTIINFIVITKGAGRIAEVSARFSLDAMPGKQMAIDADLSSGLIDEKAARERRKELEEESSFYGAMDGASKFVRGDAIAGLLITFINFVAGIIIGVVQRDLDFSHAVTTYTILTVGDGLVSQIPAIVVSLGAGLLVTKSGSDISANQAVFGQLGRFPQSMGVVSGLLIFMAMMPGLPALPLLSIAGATGWFAWFLYKRQKDIAQVAIVKEEQAETEKALGETKEEPIEKSLHIDGLRLELGYGLLPLINYQKGHRLTEQIKALRKQMARDLGFIMPPVRIQDNMQLPPNTYVIKVKDIECGRGNIRPDMLMVMDPKGGVITIPGEDTTEPTFGLPAKWVSETHREEALFRNYTVVDPPTVITTHITETMKDNIAELLSYAETRNLLDKVKEEHKKLVEDTVPSQVSITSIQRILQNLLTENISIRDLPTILEAVAESTRVTRNITIITEHVRARLARQISYKNSSHDGILTMVSLSPTWEQLFTENIIGEGDDKQLAMPPSKLQDFIHRVKEVYDDLSTKGELPVLLTSPSIRPYVRAVVERFRSSITVMSQSEVHPKARIRNLGSV